MRVNADGSGEPEPVLNGRVTSNGRTWHSWIRQPVLSPDGKTLAMVSDRPNPSNSDVVLQFYDLETEEVDGPEARRDAAARAPGPGVAARRQAPPVRPQRPRRRTRGARSSIAGTSATKKASALTGPGYLEPSFSPDGRYVAATKTSASATTSSSSTPRTAASSMRLTNDGASWAPVWSPAGDSIAFLHIEGQIVDLKLLRLDGAAPDWTVKDVTRPDRGVRARRRVATGLVRPARPAARRDADAGPDAAPSVRASPAP